jgi:hypothetical protein
VGIPAAQILAIAGDDNFRRHLLFMRYTLGIKFIDAFYMADAERDQPLEVKDAEYIAAHWRDEDKGK